MFLLLLMGLGAASVKAQVRIGGNTAPSAAAVLDLNASDAANTGKGGLVLPRVDLTSNTMQLTNGVANQTGTMVYNVTTTLGRIGVYYWNGNAWVLASLPSTSLADSGKVLISNGNTFALGSLLPTYYNANVAVAQGGSPSVTWSKLATYSFGVPALPANTIITLALSGLTALDLCYVYSGDPTWTFNTGSNVVTLYSMRAIQANTSYLFVCYRPSA